MHALSQFLVSLLGVFVIYVFYGIFRALYSELTSSLRHLPGPKNGSLLYGHMKDIDNSALFGNGVETYGKTFKIRAIFSRNVLFTVDTKAINHVLANHYDFQRPPMARYNLGRILGNGILVTEEDKHKLQRKVMNPAFGSSQIRELTEIFVEKSVQLRDLWTSQVTDEGGVARIDVLSWLSRMTLDVIGLAGFNYQFNALNPNTEPNELNKAFAAIFGGPQSGRARMWFMLQARIPLLRIFPTEENSVVRESRKTMARIGQELLNESKKSLIGIGEKANNWRAKDLLSLLVRSNMSTELPENQRMSDEDVLAQVPTFFAAGHETTATGTTWALFALSQNKAAQDKLREELLAMPPDNPTMDELNSLHYLDLVVREALRLHAPVPSVKRVAMKDGFLPLSMPVTDANGVVHHSIWIQKGQQIILPIVVLNTDKDIWGPDADEFKPERWEKLPETVTSIPGVWGNMLTFLGGARACMGWRFSLVEMKALLFVLVRSFEFELAVPKEDVTHKTTIVQRPVLKSQPGSGSQLPLLVKAYQGT